jgi:hypothetical protein
MQNEINKQMIFKPSRDAHKKPEEVKIMEQKIVQQLLAGSQNVDRMEAEIKQVVSMVIGFAKNKAACPAPRAVKNTFNASNGYWRIYTFEDSNPNRPPEAYYYDKSSFLVYSGTQTNFSQKTKVQIVHKDLDVFVKGMMEIFPGIEKSWES